MTESAGRLDWIYIRDVEIRSLAFALPACATHNPPLQRQIPLPLTIPNR